MKDFLKWLQLASSIPVHSFVFRIHLVVPKFLPHRQEHGVLLPDLLEESHGHVGPLVPGAIEVGTDSLLQVGPGLAVSPRHRDPVLVHTGAKLRHRFPAILLAASLFLQVMQ